MSGPLSAPDPMKTDGASRLTLCWQPRGQGFESPWVHFWKGD